MPVKKNVRGDVNYREEFCRGKGFPLTNEKFWRGGFRRSGGREGKNLLTYNLWERIHTKKNTKNVFPLLEEEERKRVLLY